MLGCLLLMPILAGGYFSEPPVRPDMFTAVGRIEEYCEPFPHRRRPSEAAVRRAVRQIVALENRDPELEFRIEDSAEPTTASELLNENRDFAKDKGCTPVVEVIAAARR
jgi:hypothetical protein